MKAVFLSVVLASVAVLGSSCSAEPSPASTHTQGEHGKSESAKSEPGQDEPGQDEPGQGGHVPGQHGSHDDAAALDAALVDVAALPKGYREGHAHDESPAASAPVVEPVCAPLAALVGEHPSVRQQLHPQASTTFSKSHFGPELSETVVDYGSTAAAVQALEELRAAGESCDRYAQSAPSAGIDAYAVEPGQTTYGDGEHVTLRLDAVGSDFDGLYWDLWATRAGDRLVVVGFHNARGGGNEDLRAVLPAVMSAATAR